MLSMLRKRAGIALGAILSPILPLNASADQAAIYVADDGTGSPRFASQAYDRTYRLFFTPGGRTTSPAPSKQRILGAQESIEAIIRKTARRHHLEPDLLRAIIASESGFAAKAVSNKGAIGLMQVMPATGRRYGIAQLDDPAQNIEAGTRHLKDLLSRFDASLPLSLAAYNAGEAAVRRHGRQIPPYRETMLYVPKVLAAYAGHRKNAGSALPGAVRERQ